MSTEQQPTTPPTTQTVVHKHYSGGVTGLADFGLWMMIAILGSVAMLTGHCNSCQPRTELAILSCIEEGNPPDECRRAFTETPEALE